MNNLNNYFIKFSNFMNFKLNIFWFSLWKLWISLEIIFHIIKYIIIKIFYFFLFKLSLVPNQLEIKSLSLIILFSFLFYYFFVIELSILLFGYSLLCYWFLFIFICVLILLMWKLEAEFIKNELITDDQLPIQIWINYYKNQDPLSFIDYITDYKNWPLFWFTVINRYRTDLEDGKLAVFTFFFFLLFFFFYACLYAFDPRFVKFVAKYFYPVINFFESRWNPRLEDFISATIRFRNWLVTYMEATQTPDSKYLKIARKLPKPSHRLDNEANLQRSHKTSLRKNTRFSDIFFLRAVKLNPELRWLVFDLESPTITATWFDPNWQIFFLRYVTNQFQTNNINFWNKYFKNDIQFWKLIENFWTQINLDFKRVNNQTKNNYLNSAEFSNTSYEAFISFNYLDDYTFNTKPLYEWFGANRDFYFNLTNHNKIKKTYDLQILREIFTNSAYQPTALSIKNLLKYQQKHKNWNNFYLKLENWLNQTTETAKFLLNQTKTLSYNEFKSFLHFDFNIPLYTFSHFEEFNFSEENALEKFFSKPLTTDQLLNLINRYNLRLNALEEAIGLKEKTFFYDSSDPFSLGYITTKFSRRVNKIENFLNKKGFLDFVINEFPKFEEFKFLKRKFLKFDNFASPLEKKNLIGSLLPKESEKSKKKIIKKPILIKLTDTELSNFIKLETQLRIFEWQFNLRPPISKTITDTISYLQLEKTNPWYFRTLKYFSIMDNWFVLPGFIWYYVPTPYPSTFSTFGFSWIKYQFFRKNVSSTVVGESDSIAEMKNSTPIALYSGVEAIIYIKPFLQIFDFFVKIFVKILTYPLEILATQTLIKPLATLTSLAFFIHLTWFIHFYIYFFIAVYLLYYIAVYYHRKVGFLWFYEWMFEENLFSIYTNWIYWHTINDIWVNYKTPEQFYIFAMHTNLLMHFTFFNYTQYFFVTDNKNIKNIIKLLLKLNHYKKILKNYNIFTNFYKFISTISPQNNDFLIFKSFFSIRIKKYTYLLFTGGSNCSPDHLIWSYFDYLIQSSNFITKALWSNLYNFAKINEINSLLKQFTILISSTSLETNNFFMSMPILDSLLARKLLSNLLHQISNHWTLPINLFYDITLDKNIINYILFTGYKFNYFNKFLKTGFDIYNIIENKQFYFLTKLNTNSFWDDIKYWIMIFFWSFWFVHKTRYPYVNLHMSHEVNWLQLARIAYSNSWIGQSVYVWPFFNIIQHLWWTSKLYNWSLSIVNSALILNQSGLNVIDNVWNFYEKWYNSTNNLKIETIFGFVWSLNLVPTYYLENYGEIPFANKNFDLSFPDNLIDKKTTNWGYAKTNPPLDISELGFTPNFFLNFFKNTNINYIKYYLSFFSQLETLDDTFNLLSKDLNQEFSRLSLYEGITHEIEHSFYTKYEFYLKKFDFKLHFNEQNPLKNWIFTFDTSYFFSHFTAWDYFNKSIYLKWTTSFNVGKSSTFNSENLNSFFSNFEMLAVLHAEDNWFKKPFGTLDKFELQTMKKFKFIKAADQNSLTRAREDPFLNLDKEHTSTEIGLSIYPKEDYKTLEQAYSEEFTGYRQKWFPYNPTIVKNSISPILVGWVGELYTNSIETSNFIYSLLYANSEVSPNAWKNDNSLQTEQLLLGGKNHIIETYFAKTFYQKELIARGFSWLNLILSPTAYWYTMGPKSLARLDYWSWKCGISLDYWNGLYSYRPYLGFRHNFSVKLTPFDPLYGFYQSYRQIYDNPLIIDLSTGAVDIFKPKEDEEIIQNIKDMEASTNPDFYEMSVDTTHLNNFLLPYRELYYSFHHPYFIGYLLFWILIFSTANLYLGLNNFSFKWLILKEFLLNNLIYTLDYTNLLNYRQPIENWFWKSMFKYRIYYSNPLYLNSIVDCIIDDDIMQPIDNKNTFYKYFLFNSYLFNFLNKSFNLNEAEIIFLLDYKKLFNHTFLINWLTLDLPFPTNPYLVLSNYKNTFLNSTNLDIYKTYTLSLSHYDSLRENYNFNLFYDWSTGTYLDHINLISYMSTFKGTLSLPNVFYENQSFLAASILWFPKDKSKQIGKELQLSNNSFSCQDLPIFCDLSLHNFSLVDFFQEAVEFVISFETQFYESWSFLQILKFNFKNHFFNDYSKYEVSGLYEIDSKISTIAIRKLTKFKQFLFVSKIIPLLTHDTIINFITIGTTFNNQKLLNIFYKSLWLRLFSWFVLMQQFYWKLGVFIYKLFFLKK